MRVSFIPLLSQRIHRIEAGLIPEAWRRRFRQALIPVLLMYGCGTEDKKDQEDTEGSEQAQEDDDSSEHTVIPPNLPQSSFNPKGIEEQLKQRGWGCSITLPRPVSMVWKFTKIFPDERGVRRNRDSFSISFQRDSEDSPWDFSKPKTILAPYSGTPEMENLQAEVLEAMKYGAKYIATHYDCYVGNPRGTNLD